MRIRTAEPGDAAALGRVMVTSWLSAHEGQVPEEAWLGRVAEWTPKVSAQGWSQLLAHQTSGEAPRDVLLVADDASGRTVGLVHGRPANDGPAAVGDVRALYVLPTCHRRGIGAALLRAAARDLCELGLLTVRLEVLSVNLGARAFYEHLGGREVGEGTVDEDGHLLPVTIYEWPSDVLAG